MSRIIIPREILLIEIERRCADAQCNTKARVGLTKEEARAYNGFECERCKRWNDDVLTERDVPDWWEDLMVTGLHALRPSRTDPVSEAGEVIVRMSDDYHRLRRRQDTRKDPS